MVTGRFNLSRRSRTAFLLSSEPDDSMCRLPLAQYWIRQIVRPLGTNNEPLPYLPSGFFA